MQRTARVERTRLEAVEPGGGHAAAAQHLGQRGFVEDRRVRQRHHHLVRPAVRQVALAEQPLVAGEVGQLNTHGVGLLQQLLQAQRLDAPARPHVVGRMQRRVVADHARTEGRQQLRHRARRGHHADQADRGGTEFAADEQPVAAHHRHAAQHREQRTDHELGLGQRRGGEAAHHFDAGARAGVEIDVLGARAHAADGAQQRCIVQGGGIECNGGRNDQRAHVEQRMPQRPRVARQLRRVSHGVALAEPLHDLGFQRFDDQHIHAFSLSGVHTCLAARMPQ